MTTACSTTACPYPLEAAQLWGHWRQLCGDGWAVAVDGRLHAEHQREVLVLARREGISRSELTHPALGEGGCPAASPISPERDERRTAVKQIVASIRRAAEHEVSRVLLPPPLLELSRPWWELARAHALDEALALDELALERAERVLPALDRLLLVLEGCLDRAADAGVVLTFAAPAPWPHLIPDAAELQRTLEALAGAPLVVGWRTDWAHVWSALRDGASPEPFSGVGVVYAADSCGLTPQLPLATGEVEWSAAFAGVPPGADVTLLVRSDVAAGEIERSAGVIAGWRAEARSRGGAG